MDELMRVVYAALGYTPGTEIERQDANCRAGRHRWFTTMDGTKCCKYCAIFGDADE